MGVIDFPQKDSPVNDLGWTLVGVGIGAALALGIGYLVILRYLTKRHW